MTTQIVGTLSVSGAAGPETYSLPTNPGNIFSISASQVLAPANLANGQYNIVVQADGSSSSITQPFELILSAPIVILQATPTLDNVPIGAAFAEITTDLTGTVTASFTNNPGNLFSLNGMFVQVADLLSAGTTYNIGTQVTNGAQTETATLSIICTSVADSWIPGVRPFSPISPCNTPLPTSGVTYTPVPMPASTGFNYFTGIKFYINIPNAETDPIVSWLTTSAWGNTTQISNDVMTSGFTGVNGILFNGDTDNEAVLVTGTATLNIYNFTRASDTTAAAPTAVAHDDLITGTGFGRPIASFSATGSISGNVLTVTSVASGTIVFNTGITGAGITPCLVGRQLSGTPGGAGTYLVTVSQNVASITITGSSFFNGAGVVAAGSNLMMGALLKEEFARYGAFNHWIAFSFIHTLTKSGFLPPAISSDGPGGVGTLAQTGQLFAIPNTTSMPGGLSTYGQAIFNAMQTYGAWSMDTGGSFTPYCAAIYDASQTNKRATTSWTDADLSLLIADVNIIMPLLQLVS